MLAVLPCLIPPINLCPPPCPSMQDYNFDHPTAFDEESLVKVLKDLKVGLFNRAVE